jgi:hypothetical protein
MVSEIQYGIRENAYILWYLFISGVTTAPANPAMRGGGGGKIANFRPCCIYYDTTVSERILLSRAAQGNSWLDTNNGMKLLRI